MKTKWMALGLVLLSFISFSMALLAFVLTWLVVLASDDEKPEEGKEGK